MKKSRSKALKKLAELLPDAYYNRDHTETGTLAEIYRFRDENNLSFDLPTLTEENADQITSIKSPNLEKINHHKRLKKAYTEKGTEGVQQYLVWLDGHNKRFAKRYKDLNVERLPDGLLKIAKMKVGSFWKQIVAFLYAFAITFLQKKMMNQMDDAALQELENQKEK